MWNPNEIILSCRCPELKTLKLNADLPNKQRRIIPRLIPKWKNLEVLVLDRRHRMKEILAQIALHCDNFMRLSAPGINVGYWEASAIVTLLPNLRYLVLKGATIRQKRVVMILQGCKQLVHLDVRGCTGFDEDDAEILELASHIPSFMCEGSCRFGHGHFILKRTCMGLTLIVQAVPFWPLSIVIVISILIETRWLGSIWACWLTRSLYC